MNTQEIMEELDALNKRRVELVKLAKAIKPVRKRHNDLQPRIEMAAEIYNAHLREARANGFRQTPRMVVMLAMQTSSASASRYIEMAKKQGLI